MARFFKLTTEGCSILINAGLTAGEYRLWFYLTKLDPFGDRYVELPPLADILTECNISERTFYRAIARFKEVGLFGFEYNKAYICNLSGTVKNGSAAVKNGSATVKNGSSSIYPELQTFSDPQTKEEKNECIKTDLVEQEEQSKSSHIQSQSIQSKDTHSVIELEQENSLEPISYQSENFSSASQKKCPFPDGPWLIDGKLDPNFRDYVANDWMQRYGGTIYQKRADVLSHFCKDPANLAIRWEQYQSEYLHRYQNTQTLIQRGLDVKPEYQERLVANHRALVPLDSETSLIQTAPPIQLVTSPCLEGTVEEVKVDSSASVSVGLLEPEKPQLEKTSEPENSQKVAVESGQVYKIFSAPSERPLPTPEQMAELRAKILSVFRSPRLTATAPSMT